MTYAASRFPYMMNHTTRCARSIPPPFNVVRTLSRSHKQKAYDQRWGWKVWAATSAVASSVFGTATLEPSNDDFQAFAADVGISLSPYVKLDKGSRGRGLFLTKEIKNGGVLIRVPQELCLLHEVEAGDESFEWPFWQATRLLKESKYKIPAKNTVLTTPTSLTTQTWREWFGYGQPSSPSSSSTSPPSPSGASSSSSSSSSLQQQQLQQQQQQQQQPRQENTPNDAAAAASSESEIATSSVWFRYTREWLPTPDEVNITIPIGFPIDFLQENMSQNVIQKVVLLKKKISTVLKRLIGSDEVSPEFDWAIAMALTRAFTLSEGGSQIIMIPVADMMNHSFDNTCEISQNGDVIEVRALRCLDVGEELTIRYSDDATNEQLFMKYGFVLEENPNEELSFNSTYSQLDFERLASFLDTNGAAMTPRQRTALQSLPVGGGKISRAKEKEALRLLVSVFKENHIVITERCKDPKLQRLIGYLEEQLRMLEAAAQVVETYRDFCEEYEEP